MGLRVLVCGGRDYDDGQRLVDVLDQYDIDELCHGAARGADSIAGEYAAACDLAVSVYPANWREHGKAAGPIRNQKMLRDFKPDLVVAFPGGRGTAHMVSIAKAAGVPVVNG